MSKQIPMLMESPLTKRVFVVTSYKNNGDGTFTARQKYDVTEQFDALAEQRNGTCENKAKHWGEFECSECGFYADFGSDLHRVNRCPDCGKAVK